MSTRSKKLSLEEKVNLIFDYLFNQDKHIKEELFWNELTKKEVINLKKIKKEKGLSFEELKSSL